MDDLPHAVIVAGPTCSGKSALALGLAQAIGGVVINADSMQIYRELRILTARPTPAEEGLAPHALYGVRPAAEAGSAAWWRAAALAAMSAAHAAGRLPILCGGTGLYFASLTDGLADIPEIPAAARAEARRLLAEHGPAALHDALAKVDQATAARLRPQDSQRLARAWEVWRATGRGLAAWQQAGGTTAPWRFTALLLDPPRPELRAAISTRFAAMLSAGALDEIRSLLALGLDPALPAMRAHGVPHLLAHVRGEMPLDAAFERAKIDTRRYARRQMTFARNQLPDFEWVKPEEALGTLGAATQGWV